MVACVAVREDPAEEVTAKPFASVSALVVLAVQTKYPLFAAVEKPVT
jgi:hypothetical protein